MKKYFFWCGNIILLHHLAEINDAIPPCISLVREKISDNEYCYEVFANKEYFTYRFSLTSNTKCRGSFFIESSHWKSHIYSFDKPYDFIHINQTAIDYHDICVYGPSCYLDIHIGSGRKKSITTISVQEKNNVFYIKRTSLPISEIQDNHSHRALRDIFALCGAVNQLRYVVNDAVSYTGTSLSLVSYTDAPSQIIGVESIVDNRKKIYALHSINSFFNQQYEFRELTEYAWIITEYAPGYTSDVVKRRYNLSIENDQILIPDKNLTYSYTIDNGNIIFRRL